MMGDSVAVVVLDTLRYDTFQDHFEWLPGKEFKNAYAAAHWTNPSHAALFTGHYPSEIGVHAKSRSLDCPHEVIAESLNKTGYTTRFWSANLHIYQWPGWDRGFDETVGPLSLAPTPDYVFDWSDAVKEFDAEGLELYTKALYQCLKSDSAVLPSLRHGFREFRKKKKQEKGAEAIQTRVAETEFNEQEFLVINFMETHTPYNAPVDYFSFDDPVNVVAADGFADSVEDPERIRQAYDECAEYLSEVYRGVFKTLKGNFEYVITLADHGELLGEHGMWNHGYGLYPELTHIPLMISGPGLDGAEHRPVSVLDIHQTIAALADVAVESRGQDLLSPDFIPTPRLTEYHGFLPGQLDQFQRKGLTEDIYNKYDSNLRGIVLPDCEYGFETHGGFNGEEYQKEVLEEIATNIPTRDIEPIGTTEVSDEIEEQLKDLGYG